MEQTHNFSMRPFEEIATDLSRVCDWLSALGLGSASTRVGTYRRDIEELARDYKTTNAIKLTQPKRFEQLLNSLFESTELIAIYRGLRERSDETINRKLKQLLTGPISGASENLETSSNRARNISYELLTAARLASAGYEIDLSTEADIIARKGDLVLFVECKRPHTQDSVNANLKGAFRQLRNRYGSSDSPPNARGMVALSIDKSVPVAFQVLRTADEITANVELGRVVDQFRLENEKRWINVVDQRTIAVLLDFRALLILADANLITTGHQSVLNILKDCCSSAEEVYMRALVDSMREGPK